VLLSKLQCDDQPHTYLPYLDQPHTYLPYLDQPHTYLPYLDQPHIYLCYLDQPHTYLPYLNQSHTYLPYLDQPHTYLPYLIPVSCPLFLEVKTAIRGSIFQDIDDTKNVTTKLNMLFMLDCPCILDKQIKARPTRCNKV
jgi:hypothetical protein